MTEKQNSYDRPDSDASIHEQGLLDEEPGAGTEQASTAPPGPIPDWAWILGAMTVVMVAFLVFTDPAVIPTPENPQPGLDRQAQVPRESLDNLPTDFAGLARLGHQYYDQRNFAMAAEIYSRALAMEPNAHDVRVDYGAALHAMGLPQRALNEFRTVLAVHPDHPIAIFNSGIVHRDLTANDSAAFYWNRYLELQPSGPAAQQARALLEEIKG